MPISCCNPKRRGQKESAAFPSSDRRCRHLPLLWLLWQNWFLAAAHINFAMPLVELYTGQRNKGQQDPQNIKECVRHNRVWNLTWSQNIILFISRKSYRLAKPLGLCLSLKFQLMAKRCSKLLKKVFLMKVFKVSFSHSYNIFPNNLYLQFAVSLSSVSFMMLQSMELSILKQLLKTKIWEIRKWKLQTCFMPQTLMV